MSRSGFRRSIAFLILLILVAAMVLPQAGLANTFLSACKVRCSAAGRLRTVSSTSVQLLLHLTVRPYSARQTSEVTRWTGHSYSGVHFTSNQLRALRC
jgi:hypothetical protein